MVGHRSARRVRAGDAGADRPHHASGRAGASRRESLQPHQHRVDNRQGRHARGRRPDPVPARTPRRCRRSARARWPTSSTSATSSRRDGEFPRIIARLPHDPAGFDYKVETVSAIRRDPPAEKGERLLFGRRSGLRRAIFPAVRNRHAAHGRVDDGVVGRRAVMLMRTAWRRGASVRHRRHRDAVDGRRDGAVGDPRQRGHDDVAAAAARGRRRRHDARTGRVPEPLRLGGRSRAGDARPDGELLGRCFSPA